MAGNNSTIFAGSTVKTLKPALALFNEAHVASGADDPSVVGFDAPLGSMYLRTTGEVYIKTNSSSTSWSQSVVSGGSTVSTFIDANLEIVDDLDNTKIAKFNSSGISPSTTRTLDLPNMDAFLTPFDSVTSGQAPFWDVTVDGQLFLTSEAALSPSRGGTGISNNAANTLQLSGANPLEIIVNSSSTLTVGNSGVIATLSQNETFSNKVITNSSGTFNYLEIAASSSTTQGYVGFQRHTATPTAFGTNQFRIFNQNDDHLAWLTQDGFVRKLETNLSASRTWVLPDLSGTLVLEESDLTFTGSVTFNASPDEPVHFRDGIDVSDGSNSLVLQAANPTTPFTLNLPSSAPVDAGQVLTYSTGSYETAWLHPNQRSFVAGETLAVNDAVYVSAGVAGGDASRIAGRVYKTDASVFERSINFVGFAMNTASAGSVVDVKSVNWKINPAPSGAVGDRAYLSASIPGQLTSTLTSDQYYVPVGVYDTTTSIIPMYKDVEQTEYRDSRFAILDSVDQSKTVKFQADALTAGTTRSISFPDHSGTIATLEEPQDFLGVKTFGAETIFVEKITLGGANLVSLDANQSAGAYTIFMPDANPSLAGQALTYNSGTYQMEWKLPSGQEHVAGEALSRGDVVYIAPSGDGTRTAGRVYLVDLSNPVRSKPVGFVAEPSALTGSPVTILSSGRIVLSTAAGTVGEPLFIDSSTPGAVTTVKPQNHRAVQVGICLSGTEVDIKIDGLFEGSQVIGTASIGNGSSSVAVSGLDVGGHRAALIKYSIYRSTDSEETTEVGMIRATKLQNAGSWLIDNTGVGSSGVSFSITNTGQIQYSSDTLAGINYSGDIKWHLETFDI